MLEQHSLQCAIGGCGTVGFTSWCLIGGYGCYVHTYGLGVDQIVGARVVTGEGKLIEADLQMLKGLRGGGGSLGIVVELTAKVYPLGEVSKHLLKLPIKSIYPLADIISLFQDPRWDINVRILGYFNVRHDLLRQL